MTLLRNALTAATIDASFPEWANDHARFIWESDVMMHMELFNRRFIPQLATMLECDKAEIIELHQHTCDLAALKELSRCEDVNHSHPLLVKAYVAAGILRGYYHKSLARRRNLHLAVHPYRRQIVTRSDASAGELPIASLDYLVAVRIVCSALQYRKLGDSVAAWSDAISRFHSIDRQTYTYAQLKSTTFESAAVQAAAITKQMNLKMHPSISKVLDFLPPAIRIAAHWFATHASIVAEAVTESRLLSIPIRWAGAISFERKYGKLVNDQPVILFVERGKP